LLLLAVAWAPLSQAAVVFNENFNDGTVDPAITSSTTALAVDTAPGGEQFLGRNDGINNSDPTNRGLSNDFVRLLVNSASHTQETLNFSLYIISTMDGGEIFKLTDVTLGTLFQLQCENLTAGGASCQAPSLVNAAVSGLTVTKTGENSLGFVDTNEGAVDDSSFAIALTITRAAAATTSDMTFSYADLQELTDESWGLDSVVLSTNAVTVTAPPGVPEPGTLALVAVALLGLARSRQMRARA
jgi:hypothetical protein